MLECRYDPDFICNGSDDSGRYGYKSQPEICRWNLERLAEALAPLLPPGLSRKELVTFDEVYARTYRCIMHRKLGLLAVDEGSADDTLVTDLLRLMADTGADFTNTFRRLATVPMPATTTSTGHATQDPMHDQAVGNGATVSDRMDATGSNPEAAAATDGAATAPSSSQQTHHNAATALTAELSEQHDQQGYREFLEQQLSELAEPATLAAASAPRMPADNLQMLMMIAGRDPAMLHALGASASLLGKEMQRHKTSQKWKGTSAADKRADDEKRWRAWLDRYNSRLQAEASSGERDQHADTDICMTSST